MASTSAGVKMEQEQEPAQPDGASESNDEEDDLMEISLENANPMAQSRWTKQPRVVIDLTDDSEELEASDQLPQEALASAQIKSESTSDFAPGIQHVPNNLATQQARSCTPSSSLDRRPVTPALPPDSVGDGDDWDEIDDNEDKKWLPDDEVPSPKIYRRLGHEPAYQDLFVPQEDDPTNSSDHDNSDSWMKESHDDYQDEELQNLKLLARSLKNRAKVKKLSEVEEIELLRLTQSITGIENRQAVGRREEDDEEEFRRSASADEGGGEVRGQMCSAAVDGGLAQNPQDEPHKSQIVKVKKQRRKPARNAREVEQRNQEKEREQQLKKNNKRKPNPKPANGRGGKQASGVAGRSKTRKGDVAHDTLNGILNSLVNNNAIDDRNNQEDFGTAPLIKTRNKASFFRDLIASISSTGDKYDVHKTRHDKKALQKASQRFGVGKVTVKDGKWLVKGMKTPLYHHQLLAADWMLGRELGPTVPYGGVLADAMGLGKTLEVLATMVGNPPTPEESREGIESTLIVVPASVCSQWECEIKAHVEQKTFPQVLRYQKRQELSQSTIMNHQVVICTYNEVMKSFPSPTADEIANMMVPGGLERLQQRVAAERGVLHKIHWHRVVLDEAHAIKNHASKTSLACQNLHAKYRWALSGTPIQNRLSELYAYLKFLRVEWTNTLADFEQHYCDPEAADASTRMTILLSTIMMRRTLRDKVLGRYIIELPKAHAIVTHVVFSKAERVLYRCLEDRFRDNINRHFAAGTSQRNYGMFLVQLLRLRQCTAHPFLLEQTIKDIFTQEDLEKLKASCAEQARDKRPVYEQIQQWVDEGAQERAAAREQNEVNVRDEMPFGRSEFGTKFNMDEYLQTIKPEKVVGNFTCRICGDIPDDAQVAKCQDIFCRGCIEEYIHEQSLQHTDETELIQCPACKGAFHGFIPFTDFKLRDENEDVEDDSDDDAGAETNNNKSRGKKGMSLKHKQKSAKSQKWLGMCLRGEKKLLLSAKLIAIKAQVLRWLGDESSDKIILFTQFQPMIVMVKEICRQERWGCVQFTGNMSPVQRGVAMQEFREDENKHIMVANLKCGGQGLNLTCANKVLSIDLWWNHSVEQQAFGRVFRIGQEKETIFTRLVIRNTIDMRLLDMQAEKVKIIDRAMQDGGETVAPLSLEDLTSLFGHLSKDENGVPFLEPDYDDSVEEVEDNGEGSSGGV